MKKTTIILMQALMILGVSSSLTSCQDILGEWDKPTSTVTPPQF